jgi:hypothetical protein
LTVCDAALGVFGALARLASKTQTAMQPARTYFVKRTPPSHFVVASDSARAVECKARHDACPLGGFLPAMWGVSPKNP